MKSHSVPENLSQFTHRSLKGGITLRTDFGVVSAVKSSNISSTTSSGGGGYLYQGTGYVNSPTVKTEIFRCWEVTFQRPNGIIGIGEIPEGQVEFAQGHEIALLYFDNWKWPFAAKNCSTGGWGIFANQNGHLIPINGCLVYKAILRLKQNRSPFNLKSLFGSGTDDEGAALFRDRVIKILESI